MEDSKHEKEWLILLVLASVQFTHILDFMIIMPLGPQLMRSFQIGPKEFGIIVSSYTFSAGASSMLSALFVERFDRKNVLNYSYAGFIIGTLLCGIANNYEQLLAGRIAAGAFGGLINGAIFSIIGDLIPYQRRGRATGVVMSAFSMASVAGVPIGLYLATLYNWKMPFYALSGVSVLILLFSLINLPPVRIHLNRQKHNHGPFRALAAIFHNKNHLWSFSLIMTLMFAGFTVIPYIAPYMVSNVGVTESELKFIYLLGGAATFITSRFIGYLADKYGQVKIFSALAVLSIIPILLVTHLPKAELWMALCITTLFFVIVSGRIIPAMAMITSSVHPESRGGFMSINSSLQQVAAGLASLVSSFILTSNAQGELVHYEYVGYVAVSASILSLILSQKIKRVS